VAGYLFGIARILRGGGWIAAALTNLLRGMDGRKWTGLTSDTDLQEDLARVELLECLQKAVLGLPGQYREVIVLCDLEENELSRCRSSSRMFRREQFPRGLHRARLMLKAGWNARMREMSQPDNRLLPALAPSECDWTTKRTVRTGRRAQT